MLKALCIVFTLVMATACSTNQTAKPNSQTTKASKQNSSRQSFTQTGKASYYANKFDGRQTASGEIYRQAKLTAAHKTLPFDTRVEVTNFKNGKKVILKIHDRGPFVKGRIIDLSSTAFKRIASTQAGVVDVKIKVIN